MKNLYAFIALFAVGELLVFATQVRFFFLQDICLLAIYVIQSSMNQNLVIAGASKLCMFALRETEPKTTLHGNFNCFNSYLWGRAFISSSRSTAGQC